MKEMKYSFERKIDILEHGMCFGLFYWIVSYGTHPCAYIMIPINSKYFEKDYEEIDVDVHGGLTYSNNYLPFEAKNDETKAWYIGWDYAHCGDYVGYEERVPKEFRVSGKKWTTEEIKNEVREACYQIVGEKDEQKK
jgi:hypothetical protein